MRTRIAVLVLALAAVRCLAQPGSGPGPQAYPMPWPTNNPVAGAVPVYGAPGAMGWISAVSLITGQMPYNGLTRTMFTHCTENPTYSALFQNVQGSAGNFGQYTPSGYGGYGIWCLTTAGTANGGSYMAGSIYGGFTPGNQVMVTNRWRMALTALPAAANPYILRIGWGPYNATTWATNNAAQPSYGYWFEAQTNGGSGYLFQVVSGKSGGSYATNTCSGTYYAGTYYDFTLWVDAGTNVNLMVQSNLTQVALDTIQIPYGTTTTVGNGQQMIFAAGLNEAGTGTAVNYAVFDWFDQTVVYPSSQ